MYGETWTVLLVEETGEKSKGGSAAATDRAGWRENIVQEDERKFGSKEEKDSWKSVCI